MKSNNKPKFSFIGLSLGSDSSNESGISLLDNNLNLIKSDKTFQLNEIKSIISNFSMYAPVDNTILCVDLPKNIMMLTGKWRIESKQTQILSINNTESENKIAPWKRRFSDRGSDLCSYFLGKGMEVYRYNSYYTINMLKLNPPYKIRMPAGCKFLQSIIEEKLKVKGIPANLLPLAVLHSLIGAYIGWKISNSNEDEGFKKIGIYKDLPVISALNL